MNILTVEVVCPGTSGTYDFKIPPKMKGLDLKKQIIADIRLFEGINDLFADESNTVLYTEDGTAIGDDDCLQSLAVKNASRIMIL